IASTSSRSVTSPKPRNRSTSRAVRGSGVDRDSRDQAARDSSTKGVLSAGEDSSLGGGGGKGTDLILHPQHLVNQNPAPSRLVPAHRATTVAPRDREWPASESPPDPNTACRANGPSRAARSGPANPTAPRPVRCRFRQSRSNGSSGAEPLRPGSPRHLNIPHKRRLCRHPKLVHIWG